MTSNDIEQTTPPKPKRSRDDAGRYLYTWEHNDDFKVRMIVESIKRQELNLNSLLTIQLWTSPDHYLQPFTRTKYNFRSSSAPEAVNRRLKGMVGDLQWLTRLSQVGEAVDQDFSAGDPVVDLLTVPDVSMDVEYLASPFIEKNQHTILFGPGDSMKSLFLLALAAKAIGMSTIPNIDFTDPVNVLYLDWETDWTAHKRRLTWMKAGAGSVTSRGKIFHKRMSAPLSESADEIDKLVQEKKIGLTICDSILLAVGGRISDEDAAADFYSSARLLGTVVSVAHVPKNGRDDMPIGTQAWYTQARSLWRVDKDQEEDEPEAIIALTNTKSNNDRRHRTLAYRITFTDRQIKLHKHDPMLVQAAVPRQKPKARIQSVLMSAGKRMTAAQVADELDLTQSAVANSLKAGRGKWSQRFGDSQPYEWGVLDTDSQNKKHKYSQKSDGDFTIPPPKGEEGNSYPLIPSTEDSNIKSEENPRW